MPFEVIFIGIVAGVFAGIFGIGGGIIIVPSLVLIFGWNLHFATGTSLATLLLPTGFLALMQYKRAGLLYLKGSALIALGIFTGSFFGATIALETAGPILKQLFGIFQIVIGIKYSQPLLIFKKQKENSQIIIENTTEKSEQEILERPKSIKKIVLYLVGLLAGLLGGMFGIGGGIIITTILISIYKVNPKQAVAMSLAGMFFPVGIGGVLLYNSNNYVGISAAIIIAIGIEIGSAISAKIAIGIQADLVKRLFGILLIIIGLYFILQNYIY